MMNEIEITSIQVPLLENDTNDNVIFYNLEKQKVTKKSKKKQFNKC